MAGYTHIYSGDGKGKTTAALGLALRASGAGMKVHIVQLLKGRYSSELASLAQLKNISISRCDRDYGFNSSMTVEGKIEVTKCHNQLLSEAEELMNSGKIDMLILDEFIVAYQYGLLDKALANRIVFEKNPDTELVLTGRDALDNLVLAADYVSDIMELKHPYKSGVAARKGIEY